MKDYYNQDYLTSELNQSKKEKLKSYAIHLGLFAATFITTLIAGAEWTSGTPFWFGGYSFNLTWEFLSIGLPYSIAILFIITCHEFGHYFAARYHKVPSTLPFYIPFPPIPIFLNFGTMGAVIRTKVPVPTKKAMFDIGVFGPIAGFAACLMVLAYGFANVPGEEYLLNIHPDYYSTEYGRNSFNLEFGDTLLFSFFKLLFISDGQFFPPMTEIYHYPFLCVGWFGLFITAMNMIPVGQLDGGHIAYTMFGGRNHYNIAVISFIILFVMGILGIASGSIDLGIRIGWSGWLFWALVLYFFIKLKHPPIHDDEELDGKRMFLGWFSYFILLISFSPIPIDVYVKG